MYVTKWMLFIPGCKRRIGVEKQWTDPRDSNNNGEKNISRLSMGDSTWDLVCLLFFIAIWQDIRHSGHIIIANSIQENCLIEYQTKTPNSPNWKHCRKSGLRFADLLFFFFAIQYRKLWLYSNICWMYCTKSNKINAPLLTAYFRHLFIGFLFRDKIYVKAACSSSRTLNRFIMWYNLRIKSLTQKGWLYLFGRLIPHICCSSAV